MSSISGAGSATIAAVSGLRSYQTEIDIISNDIANVGTVGYKGRSVAFQNLLYQNQGLASAPAQSKAGINARQIGNGVKVASIDTDFAQGGLQTTGIGTNLAIDGDGFFSLGDIDGGGSTSYTRDGNFSLNDSGYLYAPGSGLAVLGYPAQANGSALQGAPQPIQIPFGLKSIAVGTGFGAKTGPAGDQVFDVALGGNLNQTDYVNAVSSGGLGITSTTIATTVYDSLGGAHDVQIAFSPEPGIAAGGSGATLPVSITNSNGLAVTAATEWRFTVSSTDGSLNGAVPMLGTGYIFFDRNGQFINTSSDPLGAAAGNHVAGAAASASAGGNLMTVTRWSAFGGADNAAPVGSGTPNAAAIGLDFSAMTSLAEQTTANTLSQNGYEAGLLAGIEIGRDGTTYGAFTNGRHVALGCIAVATFQNDGGLTHVGSNRFIASANSGLAEYGVAGTGRFGAIESGMLEQSNVSIAGEFTKMILAQRSFQANAKSITTDDQNLLTVLSLRR